MNILFNKSQQPFGETRIRSAFLLFPKLINDQLRWLERATWVEQYEYCYYSDIGDEDIWDWKGVEWVA